MAVIINDRTRAAVRTIRRLSHDGLVEFVDVAVEIAATNAPFATGNHRDLIDGEVTGNMAARLFSQSGYGAYLEMGTSRMPARPHFAPAVQEAIKMFSKRKWWS